MKPNKMELIHYYETGPGIVSSTYPRGEMSSTGYRVDSISGWGRAIRNYIKRFDLKGLILDLGCGTGYWSSVLSNNGIVVSCDISSRALRSAKKDGKSIGYVRCDAEKLPFKGRSFDCTVSIALLEHVTDDSAVISEVGRVLKKGGCAAFNVPNGKPFFMGKVFWLKKFGIRRSPWERTEGHLREYTKKGLIDLAKRNSMGITDISYSWIIFSPAVSVAATILRNILLRNNMLSTILLGFLETVYDTDNLIESFPRSTNINFVLKSSEK